MSILSRIRSDILIKILLSIVVAIIIAVVPDFQKFIYAKMEPLTKAEVEKRTVQASIGYLPADDIESAGNVKEIKESDYCTITVKGSDLKATGYYRILDESQVGIKKGTGRKTPDQENLKYRSNSFAIKVMNNMGPQYGQFYVAKLANGEQVIVLLDHTVLSKKDSKEIRLPIGRVVDKYPVNFFKSISSKYGLEETGTWYVDMAGNNFVNCHKMESLSLIRFGIGVAAFILSYVILTLIIRRPVK